MEKYINTTRIMATKGVNSLCKPKSRDKAYLFVIMHNDSSKNHKKLQSMNECLHNMINVIYLKVMQKSRLKLKSLTF